MYTIEVMGRVAIIIVNWNTGRRLADCLFALHEISDRGLIAPVVVVDNQSTDDSFARGEEVCDGTLPVTLVRAEKNLGFARGNNRGLAALNTAVSERAHILLLNPDTRVLDGALGEMVKVLERRENIGVVGAHLLNPDGSTQASVRKLPTWQVLLFMLLRLQRLRPQAKMWLEYMMGDFDYEFEAEVEQVMGACILIRSDAWLVVGELDEDFSPYWFEDVDLCQRVLEAGYQTWYTPEAKVIHYGGVSFHQVVGLKRTWPWVKNTLVYAHKHLGWPTTALLTLFAPGSLFLALFGFGSRRRQQESNRERLS